MLFTLCFYTGFFSAQGDEPTTIKVRKEQDLKKAFFDNIEMKLTVIDRFGNPKENKIVSYKLWIKSKNVKEIYGHDNKLSNEMIKELNKQKRATKIFFTEINAQDDAGHLIKLPDVIEVWFPDCKNCGPKKRD